MGWVNKASLTLTLFTEVPVPSQESEQSCVCVLVGIDFASFYDFSNFVNQIISICHMQQSWIQLIRKFIVKVS
jgi:hypothetical protein